MSNNNTLFAPPSAEELKKTGSDLFAPPSPQEIKQVSLGNSPDNAIPTDLFGNIDRVKSGFGNDSGIAQSLVKKGYVGAQRNKNGDLVFRNTYGTWVKDANGFSDHPLNWAESNVGRALPIAGMVAGTVMGAPASIPGALAVGGAGSATGEALRQGIGHGLGVNDSGPAEATKDVVLEGLAGMGAEGAGRLLAPVTEPIVKGGINLAGKALKGVVSRGSEFLSGAPKEAVARHIERPTQILGAESEGNALNVARQAREEFLAKNVDESKAIGDARQTFRKDFGDRPVDSATISKDMGEFSQRNPVTEQGYGALAPAETQSLGQIEKDIPNMNAKDLSVLGDHIDRMVKNFDQSKVPGSGDTKYQWYLRRLYGQVKGKLHEIDPQGLGAADKAFTEYADNAGRLGRLENPDQMESFINNYFGKNKTLMRESAQKIIPNSVEDIADIGASRAFSKQGPAGSEMGRRSIGGVAAGGLVASGLHGTPLGMALGLATAASTSPQLHKQVIGRGAQLLDSSVIKMIQNNPNLIESVANPELKALLQNVVSAGNASASEEQEQPGSTAGEMNHPDKNRQIFLEKMNQ